MKVSFSPATLFAAFDDPDLIAYAGLFPMIRLAERCGLPRLVAEKRNSRDIVRTRLGVDQKR